MLSWEYPPVLVGGLGRHVHALSRALAKEGHDVTVVTRDAPGVPLEEQVDGVRIVRAMEDPPLIDDSQSGFLTWTMALNHTLTRAGLRASIGHDFDVIHAHDWLVAHAAVTLKETLRLPLVATVHATEAGRHQGWLPEAMNKSIHSVEWWLAHEACRLVVCSHYMAWEVNRLMSVSHRRVEVIPNGVEPALWLTDQAEVEAFRAQYERGGPLIGFAGRLVYEKGVQDIVDAMPLLAERHPGIRLLVAGDGPYAGELRDRVHRSGLGDSVVFTGFLGADLPVMMAATDAMVVPSLYEPFGMIALEAAAVGTPTAAASTGGLMEIIRDAQTGAVFPPGRADALADAVSLLLGDPASARRMADAARETVAAQYAWTSIARRTADAYARAVVEAPAFERQQAVKRRVHGPSRIVVPEGNLL